MINYLGYPFTPCRKGNLTTNVHTTVTHEYHNYDWMHQKSYSEGKCLQILLLEDVWKTCHCFLDYIDQVLKGTVF